MQLQHKAFNNTIGTTDYNRDTFDYKQTYNKGAQEYIPSKIANEKKSSQVEFLSNILV